MSDSAAYLRTLATFEELTLSESKRLLAIADELEAAQKDAQRLDHIANNARSDPKMDGNHVWWPTTFGHQLKGPTLRAAIDAAMKVKP